MERRGIMKRKFSMEAVIWFDILLSVHGNEEGGCVGRCYLLAR